MLFFLFAGKEGDEQLQKGVNISSAFPLIFGETGLVIQHVLLAHLLKVPHSSEAKTWVLKSGITEFESKVCHLQMRTLQAICPLKPQFSICKMGLGNTLFPGLWGRLDEMRSCMKSA